MSATYTKNEEEKNEKYLVVAAVCAAALFGRCIRLSYFSTSMHADGTF